MIIMNYFKLKNKRLIIMLSQIICSKHKYKKVNKHISKKYYYNYYHSTLILNVQKYKKIWIIELIKKYRYYK